MDELDRLLAESMRDHAGDAPGDDGLLGSVHRRSARYRRQRIATVLSAAVVMLAVAVPAVLVLLSRAPEVAPAEDPLVAGYTLPVFPYTLPASAGLRAPVASMRDGDLTAFFEAPEQVRHADTTITVSTRRPAQSGTPSAVTVRGHAGTLSTVDVAPAKQLTLVWPESAGRWIRLATDDTYTPQQVVHLADSLTPAAVPVLPPFRLDYSPAGLAVTTVTASRISFGTVEVVLRKRRPLPAANTTVGANRADLTRTAGSATLTVDVPDWDATLQIRATGLGDADLLRFAAGVHILNRSDPE
jgi:hypothetical protein